MTRALDVPAGCGGFSLGAHRAGCEVRGVELDADACETHRANVGPCDHADMREYHPDAPYDIVIGGVPCQSFSLAGKRGGMRDPRGELYQHLVRIAVEANARAVVLENVRGLLSWRDVDTGASAIDVITTEMRRHGFAHVSRCVLNAKHYGVPQSRQRIFVVAFREAVTFRWPGPTHAERGNVLGLAPYVTVREALGLGPGAFAADAGGRDSWQGMRSIDVDGPAYTVGTRNNADKLSPLDSVSPCVSATEGRSNNDGKSGGGKARMRRAGDVLNPHLGPGVLDRPAQTISAGGTGGGGAEPLVSRAYRKAFTEAMLDSVSRAVIATEGDDGNRGAQGGTARGRGASSSLGGRLTYRQCATLQGFPADFEFTGNAGSRYRQAGNAVPPALGEAVIRAVVEALERKAAA